MDTHITARDVARFWAKVEVLPKKEECWNWRGGTSRCGYGVFNIKVGDRWLSHRAHRVSWVLANGPFPSSAPPGRHGWVVMHKCDNPSCVNPLHLSLGSQSENFADMVRKNRANPFGGVIRSGTAHPMARLSLGQVEDIKRSTEMLKDIARKHGISIKTAWRIRAGISHVGDDAPALAAKVQSLERRIGLRPGNAKLTPEMVRAIRSSPDSGVALASRYGVSKALISQVRLRRKYKDVV